MRDWRLLSPASGFNAKGKRQKWLLTHFALCLIPFALNTLSGHCTWLTPEVRRFESCWEYSDRAIRASNDLEDPHDEHRQHRYRNCHLRNINAVILGIAGGNNDGWQQ